ncbi:MAG: hypothetical protein M3Y50_11555 [Acidobacteriota bacterium]|nr:hypothetical protein [Acidobacteriota bacterium]
MQANVRQVFYFHTDAVSLGGFVEEPFRYIPTPSSVALSSAGGSVRSRAGEFGFEDVISCRSSYTHTSGRPAKQNGPWTSRSTAVVEGLNILGRVTADRIVARIHMEHTEAGDGRRRISFAGTQFEGLRLDGKQLDLSLNQVLLPKHGREFDVYNEDESLDAELESAALWRTAHAQANAIAKGKDTPEWARARFGWAAKKGNSEAANEEGYAICSLVDRIDGAPSGQVLAHSLELPEVGRFFFGEAVVFPHSLQLAMVRAELGCATTGQTVVAMARVNGSTCPPG